MVGICNGFQVLTEAQLLPGALQKNAGLKFLCETVELRVETTTTVLTERVRGRAATARPDQPLRGQLRVRRARRSTQLRADDRVVVRYTDNPNGSLDDIAGICNDGRNVVGSCRTRSARPTRCSVRPTASCCCVRCSRPPGARVSA